MAVVGPSQQNPLCRIWIYKQVQQVTPAADCRHRIPVCESLSVDRQVRRNAAQGSVSAERVPEAGLDFIEDQDEAEFIRNRAKPFEITLPRLYNTYILQNRLGDEARGRILFGDVPDGLQIVEVNRVNQRLMTFRNAGAERDKRILTGRNAGSHDG